MPLTIAASPKSGSGRVCCARAGHPVARLTTLVKPARQIRFGVLKGKAKIADDFDAPLSDEVLAQFEGR
jgi:antitoxin (DNA-binding transcriptional repressor) of toxin-antitoxin stability system